MRGIAEANWSMRFLVSLGTSSAISERGMRLPRFARNDRGELLNKLFKNGLGQFIGRLYLMNQATTKR
ncbi:MAG: hypothetical protein AUK39_01245 [Dehalococcoidia bacterium CG2_30_46_19]|nr:MAG: hypothetical protein AUK39_01245 [Dehalococcoidia bacterium CG2_30_46_19]